MRVFTEVAVVVPADDGLVLGLLFRVVPEIGLRSDVPGGLKILVVVPLV